MGVAGERHAFPGEGDCAAVRAWRLARCVDGTGAGGVCARPRRQSDVAAVAVGVAGGEDAGIGHVPAGAREQDAPILLDDPGGVDRAAVVHRQRVHVAARGLELRLHRCDDTAVVDAGTVLRT